MPLRLGFSQQYKEAIGFADLFWFILQGFIVFSDFLLSFVFMQASKTIFITQLFVFLCGLETYFGTISIAKTWLQLYRNRNIETYIYIETAFLGNVVNLLLNIRIFICLSYIRKI